MQFRRDEARDVGHVHHQERPDLLADLGELGEVEEPRVGACTRNDQPRLVLAGLLHEVVEVDPVVFFPDAVAGDLEVLAGEVQPHPVGEVAAVGEVEAEDGVAGVEGGEEHAHVRLRPGVGLHVGVLGAE